MFGKLPRELYSSLGDKNGLLRDFTTEKFKFNKMQKRVVNQIKKKIKKRNPTEAKEFAEFVFQFLNLIYQPMGDQKISPRKTAKELLGDKYLLKN